VLHTRYFSIHQATAFAAHVDDETSVFLVFFRVIQPNNYQLQAKSTATKGSHSWLRKFSPLGAQVIEQPTTDSPPPKSMK